MMKRRRCPMKLLCALAVLAGTAPSEAWMSSQSRSSYRLHTTHLCSLGSKELRDEKTPDDGKQNFLGKMFSRKNKEEKEIPKEEGEKKGGFPWIFSANNRTKEDKPPPDEESNGFLFFRGKKEKKQEPAKEEPTKGSMFFSKSDKSEEKREEAEEAGGGFFSFGREDKPDEEEAPKGSKSKQQRSRTSRAIKEQKQKQKTKTQREPKPRKPPRKTRVESKQSDGTSQERKSTPSPLSKFLSNAFSSNGKEEWVSVFPKTRLSPGEIVPATVGGIDLLVVASKDGRKLYCIANSCPHLGTPLETGQIVRLPTEEKPSVSLDAVTATVDKSRTRFTEMEITNILQQDGLEDCIVCPLHRTAFALESGQVRGEWCPYPPVVGKIVGTIKPETSVAIFDIRTKGKDIQVRINTPLEKV